MKRIISKIRRALQVILLAPIKLPGKALDVIKYLAIAVGIVESVIDEEKETDGERTEEEVGGKDEDQ